MQQGPGRMRRWGSLWLGPETHVLLLSLSLIIGPSGLFIWTPGTWVLSRQGPTVLIVFVFLLGLVLGSMLASACGDPGVLPRRAGEIVRSTLKEQDLLLQGNVVRIKTCPTCRIVRPPRCSHCSVCDCCILELDHHCPWLGICIGRRNYRAFFVFVWSAVILDLYVLSFSVYYLVVSANDKSKEFQVSQTEGFARVLASNPTALILAIFAFVFLWFVLGLACFHTFLVLTGRTTIEQLKQSFPHGSPFSRGYVQNCLFLYLRRIPDSFIDSAPERPQAERDPSSRIRDSSVMEMIEDSKADIPQAPISRVPTFEEQNAQDVELARLERD